MSFSQIVAPGVTNTTSIPGNWVSLVLGAGQSSDATTDSTVVVFGDSNGSATADGTVIYGPDTTVPVRSYSDAVSLFGKATELTQFANEFFTVNPTTPLYFIPVTDSGTKGSQALTLTGTATVTSMLTVFVNTYALQVVINPGDTANAIGASLVTQVSMLNREFTAANISGAVTFTAGSAGIRNTPKIDATLQVHDSGLSVAVAAATPGTSVIAASTAAIATLGSARHYYQVMLPGFDEGTVLVTSTVKKLSDNLTAQSLPLNDNRNRGFTSAKMKSTDASYATAFAQGTGDLATLINNPLMEVAWAPASDATAALILARYVGYVALLESAVNVGGSLNLNNMGLTVINGVDTSNFLPAPRSKYKESNTAYNTALNVGLTCIASRSGKAFLLRRVTTSAWDAVNSVPNTKIRDPHKVFVCDLFCLDLQAKLSEFLTGKLIGDDPISPNDPLPENTITPRVVKAAATVVVRKYAALGLIQNEKDAIKNMLVQRNPAIQNRMELKVQLVVCDIFNQMISQIDQIN